jgi:hypothetical protein
MLRLFRDRSGPVHPRSPDAYPEADPLARVLLGRGLEASDRVDRDHAAIMPRSSAQLISFFMADKARFAP